MTVPFKNDHRPARTISGELENGEKGKRHGIGVIFCEAKKLERKIRRNRLVATLGGAERPPPLGSGPSHPLLDGRQTTKRLSTRIRTRVCGGGRFTEDND